MLDGHDLFRQPVLAYPLVRRLRNKSQRRRTNRVAVGPKHGPRIHGLRRGYRSISVAHLRVSNHPTFNHQLGPDAKKSRLPQHQIGELTRLHRTDLGRESMSNSWIDGVFGDVAPRAKVVITAPVLG